MKILYNHLELLNIKFTGNVTYFWESELIMLEQLGPVFGIYV
jgi:hypothetical protein